MFESSYEMVNTDWYKQLCDAIQSQQGGMLYFQYISPDFLDTSKSGRLFPPIAYEGHFFGLQVDPGLKLSFYYTTPGTGTRHAEFDLSELDPPVEKLLIGLYWSPLEISITVCNLTGKETFKIEDLDKKRVIGIESSKKIVVDKFGNTYELGDKNITIKQPRIYFLDETGAEKALEPSAIQLWRDTAEAIQVLYNKCKGDDSDYYPTTVVTVNLCLSAMVTGFEVYCKKRFIEIELEGLSADKQALIEAVFSEEEINIGEVSIHEKLANDNRITFLEHLANKRINFQSYKRCKTVFNKAYKIKFGEIGLESNDLDWLQKYIQYRHRIIHVSPLNSILEINQKTQVFSTKELGIKALECFNKFITALHKYTLSVPHLNQQSEIHYFTNKNI